MGAIEINVILFALRALHNEHHYGQGWEQT